MSLSGHSLSSNTFFSLSGQGLSLQPVERVVLGEKRQREAIRKRFWKFTFSCSESCKRKWRRGRIKANSAASGNMYLH